MYEGVHAWPDGESTVARLAATASSYGFEGIVVRNHGDAQARFEADKIRSKYGIDVIEAIEIRTDSSAQASGLVGNYRSKRTIVCVHGGPLNRFATEQSQVDVLAHPMQEGDINHVLAKNAVANNVHLEFNFSQILRSTGGTRVQAIQDLTKLWDLVEKYDVPYVVSADAHSHLGIRSPRELQAIGEVVGLSENAIKRGLEAWEDLAERNRKRRSDTYLEPGVRIEPQSDHEDPTPQEDQLPE